MRKIVLVLAAVFAMAAPAHAQYIMKWFYGTWSCSVGGMPGKLVWGLGAGDPALNHSPACQGCSQSEGGTIGGHFTTPGLAPTYLKESVSDDNVVNMQGPGTIGWVLNRRGNSAAMGSASDGTTSVPVSCTR
jgi:hypothetical protein